jgi:hypothetical protein
VGAPDLPSVVFLSPVPDTTISVEHSQKLSIELLICGLGNGKMKDHEIIIYLNSNIVYREKISSGMV